jgi:hypothetical protein
MRSIQPKRIDPKSYAMPTEAPKAKDIYPQIHLSHEFFPEVKDWKDGKSYKVTLELKQVASRTSANKDDEYSNESTFEIKKIAS